MKTASFFIFFTIILVLYTLAHYYLYIRTVQAFPLTPGLKKWGTVTYILLASSFIIGMFLERVFPSVFAEYLYKTGTAWLAFLLYFIISLLIIDFIRIINHFFHFIPLFSQNQKMLIGIIVIITVSTVVCAGHINAKHIRVKHISLNIPKHIEGNKQVKILMASDLHLGAIIGKSWEQKFLHIVQKEKPDLILLCGDLIDGEIAPVLRRQLGEHIQEISTPFGLYAITGNHEYIGNINKSLSYLKSIHINVLQDEVMTLPNGIQLVGRKDIQSQYADPNNPILPLDSLLQNIDRTKPIIVMKHQPSHLEEASNANVDLHLSGHTHNGQLWPFNYITQGIYELSWGYMKKGNTHFYVSSGFGTWGPSVRIGNRPEVVVFDIQFQ